MRSIRVIPLAAALCISTFPLLADGSFTCPVTKPIESASPEPFSSAAGKWFGTEKLWTLIEPGRWIGTRKTDAGFLQPKLVWFSSGYDWKQEPDPALTVTGRRIDAPSAPLIFHGAHNAFISGQGSFMTSSATLPTLGCWEITARYHDQGLTFVVNVHP